MFEYLWNCSSKACHVCCEDSPTKDFVIIVSQSDEFALHSRSQLRLKFDKCLTSAIIDYNYFNVGYFYEFCQTLHDWCNFNFDLYTVPTSFGFPWSHFKVTTPQCRWRGQTESCVFFSSSSYAIEVLLCVDCFKTPENGKLSCHFFLREQYRRD